MGKYTVQEAIDILEKDSLIYNDEAWQTLKAVAEQRADNIGSPKLPCPHLDNIGGCCKEVGHTKCTCKYVTRQLEYYEAICDEEHWSKCRY